jgi:Protein of unknown function (DUF3160)
MKITPSIFIISLVGLILISCKSNPRSKNTLERKTDTQTVVINEKSVFTGNKNNRQDSVLNYNPNERETKNSIKGVFDIPEIFVNPSPVNPQSIALNQDESLIDFDVSPAGLIVASLVSSPGKNFIRFWNINQDFFFDEISFVSGIIPKSITWNPQADAIYVVATEGAEYKIIRFDKENGNWAAVVIFSSTSQIKRLVFCPRPFIVSYDDNQKASIFSYRLFFGLQKPDNSYRIVSLTEFGNKFYQVIGPAATFTHSRSEEEDPSKLKSEWAVPLAFHPSGRYLIWNDSNGDFQVAEYASKYWAFSKPVYLGLKSGKADKMTGGTITPTPNGLGFIHWQKNKQGIGIIILPTGNEKQILTEYQFISTPSSVPDGKGIVALTNTKDKQTIIYLPIQIPQADVVNAWMFSEKKEDMDLFVKNHGLFRPLNDEQLYSLYESENYYCNSYDQTTPTRPFLITTDIFWELFGSAFQGIFTVKERTQAIPAFWNFINSAYSYFKDNPKYQQWTVVFEALSKLQKNDLQNKESNRILNSEEKIYSEVLKQEYDYSQLKPRGFYTSTTQMQIYFRAFKYLTTVYEKRKEVIKQLNNLPPDIKKYAIDWIESYNGFISPGRRENIFLKNISIPNYVQFPDTGISVFPISWGFDNEALNASVYHSDYPKDRQIISKTGDLRLLPSGLDLAAAFSNNFAASIMEEEYSRYPNLRSTIERLRNNFKTNGKTNVNNSLYDRWIDAISTQWIDTVHSTSGTEANNIWQTKRLQTGLASWATLRHATVLVNETGAAECGEAGFEEILMRAPRGYVEADPCTFGAIADLFESAISYVPRTTEGEHDVDKTLNRDYNSLYEGIIRRLKETAEKTRMFQTMAEKETKGIPLTNEEYETILYVARVAEHNFLIFKSLANEDNALAKPDPMPKITNVFGIPETSYLMAAVGKPLEWDFTVPFFGRQQIVKGSVYSYYEFSSNQLLNDKEWLQMVDSKDFLPWIKPFISKQNISYPPLGNF